MKKKIKDINDLKTKSFKLKAKTGKNGHAPRVPIPGVGDAYDHKTERMRTATYIPGQTTIWLDELEKRNISDKLWNRGETIYFINGWKHVDPRDKLLSEYLTAVSYNDSLYELFNGEKIAADSNQREMDRVDALHFVLRGDISHVRAYALALAPNMGAMKEIETYDNQRIRQALRVVAEKSPEKFKESMKEASVTNKVSILRAIGKETIYVDENDSNLTWKGGDKFIEAPTGMNIIDFLSEMATKSQKHKNIMKDIVEAAGLDVEEDKEVKPIGWAEAMVNEALKAKVLEKSDSSSWVYVYKDTAKQLKFRGIKNLIKGVELNKEGVRDILTKELQAEKV